MVHEPTTLTADPEFPALLDVTECNTVVITSGEPIPEIGCTGMIVSTKALNPFPDAGYYVGQGSTLAFKSGMTVATGYETNAAATRNLFGLNRTHSQWMGRPVRFNTAKLTNAVFSGKLNCRLARSKLMQLRRSRPSNNFVGITFHCPRPHGLGTPLTLVAFESGRLNFPGSKTIDEVRCVLRTFYADLMTCADADIPAPPTSHSSKKAHGLQRTTTRKTHRVKDLNKHTQFIQQQQQTRGPLTPSPYVYY